MNDLPFSIRRLKTEEEHTAWHTRAKSSTLEGILQIWLGYNDVYDLLDGKWMIEYEPEPGLAVEFVATDIYFNRYQVEEE